jgi:hypothetical protein
MPCHYQETNPGRPVHMRWLCRRTYLNGQCPWSPTRVSACLSTNLQSTNQDEICFGQDLLKRMKHNLVLRHDFFNLPFSRELNKSEIMRTFPNVCTGDLTMVFEHVHATTCKNNRQFHYDQVVLILHLLYYLIRFSYYNTAFSSVDTGVLSWR